MGKKTAGKAGNISEIRTEHAICQEWRKNSVLKKFSPEDLEGAAKIVEATQRVSLLNSKTTQYLEKAFKLVGAWKKDRILSKRSPRDIIEMLSRAEEWRKIFGRSAPVQYLS